ncbi:hypothetical protein EEB13_03260 [Rhodococcus sp. WS3]|uniref:hypothetical protein n=1 Tax=Rhodococcus sp. WS3 TaxID=2486271 RepID=UPI001144A855|nr:hypothetical protein [Rhodococcus sp. WS3]ROZ48991.1 hypothetical protein EEB13_03260 [Rhodococcus sp. WS3]
MHTTIAAANTHQRLLLAATLVLGFPSRLNIIAATPAASPDPHFEQYLAARRCARISSRVPTGQQ